MCQAKLARSNGRKADIITGGGIPVVQLTAAYRSDWFSTIARRQPAFASCSPATARASA